MLDYLVYYSKSKIDTLYSQIENIIHYENNGQVNVNLGVLKSEISMKNEIEYNYINKLNIIISQLEKDRLIGGINEYKDYIKGSLFMGWETYDITHWGTKIYDADHMFIISLFGSKENIKGEPYKGTFDSGSIYPNYIKFAEGLFDAEKTDEKLTWNFMEAINNNYDGEYLQYEFVAKVLYNETLSLEYRTENCTSTSIIDPSAYTTYILATPLYVGLPNRICERVRRFDGRNYVVVENLQKRLKRKGINNTALYLYNLLYNANLINEALEFQNIIGSFGNNIDLMVFKKIVLKYFIIPKDEI